MYLQLQYTDVESIIPTYGDLIRSLNHKTWSKTSWTTLNSSNRIISFWPTCSSREVCTFMGWPWLCRTGLCPLPVIPVDPGAAPPWLGFGTGDILRSSAGGCIAAGGVELLGGVGGGPCPRGGGGGGAQLSLEGEGAATGCEGTRGGGSLCAADALGGRAGAWASCCS